MKKNSDTPSFTKNLVLNKNLMSSSLNTEKEKSYCQSLVPFNFNLTFNSDCNTVEPLLWDTCIKGTHFS